MAKELDAYLITDSLWDYLEAKSESDSDIFIELIEFENEVYDIKDGKYTTKMLAKMLRSNGRIMYNMEDFRDTQEIENKIDSYDEVGKTICKIVAETQFHLKLEGDPDGLHINKLFELLDKKQNVLNLADNEENMWAINEEEYKCIYEKYLIDFINNH